MPAMVPTLTSGPGSYCRIPARDAYLSAACSGRSFGKAGSDTRSMGGASEGDNLCVEDWCLFHDMQAGTREERELQLADLPGRGSPSEHGDW